jgi:Protein of unknown function (DUF3375)
MRCARPIGACPSLWRQGTPLRGRVNDIIGQLARVRTAFETPTLTLLHQLRAPVIVSIFRSAFSRDRPSVPAPRLHEQVDTYLDQLRLDGHPGLPTGSGRDLCLRWMRDQWLVRSTEDDGTEVYSLTSHAQDALSLVTNLTRERASLSEHRIATIVAHVRRFNAEGNPDRAERVRILDAEIARLAGERSRLLDGEPLDNASADYMLEGFSELLQLIAALPGDFARVEEAFVALRGRVLASFQAEDRHAGDVIDEYLRRTDTLMTATPEGRAFAGAFALLRDDELLLQLREDLTALLAHPLADDILSDGDRQDLRGTVALINRGINSVLVQRNRVTATLRDYIVTHDVAHDRELDAALRGIDAALGVWMRTAGPRRTVPLEIIPRGVDVTHLRERFFTPDEDAVPPLADVSDHRPGDVLLADLLAQGGPQLEALRRALASLAEPGAVSTLGELFATLGPALRRPVEIFGLLQLAHNSMSLAPAAGFESYPAVRPDGSTRQLTAPKIGAVGAASDDAAGGEETSG